MLYWRLPGETEKLKNMCRPIYSMLSKVSGAETLGHSPGSPQAAPPRTLGFSVLAGQPFCDIRDLQGNDPSWTGFWTPGVFYIFCEVLMCAFFQGPRNIRHKLDGKIFITGDTILNWSNTSKKKKKSQTISPSPPIPVHSHLLNGFKWQTLSNFWAQSFYYGYLQKEICRRKTNKKYVWFHCIFPLCITTNFILQFKFFKTRFYWGWISLSKINTPHPYTTM